MNSSDPLAQLRDIHLPEAISWWPPAPGWWLAALLLIGVLLWSCWTVRAKRQNALYRREALQNLRRIRNSFDEPQQLASAIDEVAAILRRTAKTAFPADHWEALPTPKMLPALNSCCKTPAFDISLVGELQAFLYRNTSTGKHQLAEDFTCAAERWIKHHRRDAGHRGRESC